MNLVYLFSYISLVTTTSTPVLSIFFITISPLFTGDFNSTFFKSSIHLKFNSLGIESLVFTGTLLCIPPVIFTVEVITLFGAVSSSLPYFSPGTLD